jgi:hypothetical protein
MVRYAARQGIRPMICTNGGLWTEENMRALASDGLSSVIMSIDAHDIAVHEKNRGLPDVCRKIKRANEFFPTLGVQTTASITASRLIEDYDKLFPAALSRRHIVALLGPTNSGKTHLALERLSRAKSRLSPMPIAFLRSAVTSVLKRVSAMVRTGAQSDISLPDGVRPEEMSERQPAPLRSLPYGSRLAWGRQPPLSALPRPPAGVSPLERVLGGQQRGEDGRV